MLFLIERLWPVLAGATGLGLLASFVLGPGRGSASAGRVVPLGCLAAIGLAMIVALSGLAPGRPGLWLDIGALVLCAYALGCLVGTGIRHGLSRPRAGGGDAVVAASGMVTAQLQVGDDPAGAARPASDKS